MTPRWRSVPPSAASGLWSGELVEHAPVGAPGIAPRPLFAYLPPSYGSSEASSGRIRPLLLMHDGQNLFDPATSFVGSWRVPEAIDALDAETGRAPVVIGVPNGGARRLWEYAPFRDPRWGGGGAARHLGFLVERVRPLAVRSFAVDRRTPAHALGGASLGALVSLWGLFASGGEFGSVLAMSPTTLFAGEALRGFLARRAHLPARIYLDCGLEEWRRRSGRKRRPTSPTAYVRRVRRLKRTLERLGYRRGDELEYLEEPGGIHHESAWARRLPGALRWLYPAGD